MDFMFTRIRVALMRSALTRSAYLVKHKVFASVGENFFFQPRIIPIDAKYIRFHNNVSVASDVTFVCHDVAQKVFNNLDPEHICKKYYGCIEVMDNVFIGCNSTILYNVKIGPNAIVAAGSLVTKDVPPGTIVGGVPAKVIGRFDVLYRKRIEESNSLNAQSYDSDTCWRMFEEKKESCNDKQ